MYFAYNFIVSVLEASDNEVHLVVVVQIVDIRGDASFKANLF
jgi:hypothetical protein